MAECGGDVVVHKEVTIPSETVAQDGSKEEEAPVQWRKKQISRKDPMRVPRKC